MTPSQRQSRDSLQSLATSLDELLDRATKAPLPSSFRGLATATALRGDRRTKTLNDSLDVLERQRAALGPTSGAERAPAEITERVNDVGARIREVAARRRARLARDIAQFEASAGVGLEADSSAARAESDSASLAVHRAESMIAVVRSQNARTGTNRDTAATASSLSEPPAAMLVASYVLVVLGGFGWRLASELRQPTTLLGAHRKCIHPDVLPKRPRGHFYWDKGVTFLLRHNR